MTGVSYRASLYEGGDAIVGEGVPIGDDGAVDTRSE